ncbi:MAG: hypothetical protein A2Y97_09050 [Nitrospirae bacterium RBG_13_39_12]|nr:MAG: hypothetical protein A2Y97_09050 [Nitrospirae bacterium RBG_13_39_12]
MNIAFLVTRLDSPSVRYRVLQYIPCLEREGFLPEVFVIPKNHMDRLSLFRIMKDFDLVFLHRKLLSTIWWLLLRKNSRNLIYDFDDAVMFRDSAHKNPFSARKMNSFKRIIRNADIVIAGNEYLKNFAVNENCKTFVVPTPIDMNRYTGKPSAIGSDPLILGWIGSSVTLFYLENMKNVLDTIFDRFPFVRLKIIADKFFDCDRMPVIKKQWVYEEEISDLHSFDIGLMPLTHDPWSMGKCGFKLLQYMAVGVPAVCSPVGVNKEIVIDGENGFWADSELEWIDKVGELVKNHQLRIEMGIRARKTVIERYSTDVNGKKITDLFNILNNTGQRKKLFMENKYYFPLSKDKKLFLIKGKGWKESYFDKIIKPLLKDESPLNAQQIDSSPNSKCWNVYMEDSSLFIKIFSFRNIFDRLSFFKKSRSTRAWQGGMLLLKNGFSTPDLIARGDILKRFWVQKTFLITQALNKSSNIYDYINILFNGRSFETIQKKREFIITIGRLIGRLHKTGIFHGDLRPGNILINHLDNKILFHFIDNERNKYFPEGIPDRLREKNLVQINMIVTPLITFTDRLRFFKEYLNENTELKPYAKDLTRKIFLKTRKRLQKLIPEIWGKY